MGREGGKKSKAKLTSGSRDEPNVSSWLSRRMLLLIFGVCAGGLAFVVEMSRESDGFASLIEWMRARGATVHKSIKVVGTSHGGFEIRGAVTRTDLAKGELLVRVPRSLVLDLNSMPTLSPAKLHKKHPECKADFVEEFVTTVGLALELKKGDKSTFWPILRLFPPASMLRMSNPNFAEPSVQKDFGELPLLRVLRRGHEEDVAAWIECFEAWMHNPSHGVAELSLDDVFTARLSSKTRFFRDNALAAFHDIWNTVNPQDNNIEHGSSDGYEIIRTTKRIPAGSELTLTYCEDCDNEMLMSLWGIYLENNVYKLNDFQTVNCSASWAGNRPPEATVDSLQQAALAVLDLSGHKQAFTAGWRSPRCQKNPRGVPLDEQPLRCSLARLAWERCAGEWGYEEWRKRKGRIGKMSAKVHSSFYANDGVKLYMKGDLQGAASKFRKGIEMYPAQLTFHTNLGNVLKEMEDFQGAISSFKAALRIDPTSDDVKEELATAEALLADR